MPTSTLEDDVAGRARRLHVRASNETALTDFGEPSYTVGLSKFLRDLLANPLVDDDVGLADTMVVAILRSRLYSQAGWAGHREYESVDLRAPVVILGIPRTGTTLLHKLLALDPQFQVLENWLIDQPTPRPPLESRGSYPGYLLASARAASRDEEARRRHDIGAGDADECIRLMSQDFVGNLLGAAFPVPEFDVWWRAQDLTPVYRRYADNLRLIGLSAPERTWLLKNPSHVGALGPLLAVFPDARIVQTHRDPWEAVSSCASLVAGRQRLLGRSFDAHAVGARELDYWSWAASDCDAVRDQVGVDVCDVDYRELASHPVRVARRVYEHFGMDLAPAVEATMRAWVERNPQDKLGRHVYSGSDYGLTPDEVSEAFGSYVARHGLDRVGSGL
jgi:hypothetical protein